MEDHVHLVLVCVVHVSILNYYYTFIIYICSSVYRISLNTDFTNMILV